MPSEVQEHHPSYQQNAQIEQDFKDALADLPKKAELSANDIGRATSGAAKGMLAKAYLYLGEAEYAGGRLSCGNSPAVALMPAEHQNMNDG